MERKLVPLLLSREMLMLVCFERRKKMVVRAPWHFSTQFRALHLHHPLAKTAIADTHEREESNRKACKGQHEHCHSPEAGRTLDVTLQSPAPQAKRHLSVPRRHPTCIACGGQLQPFARCPVRRRTRTWPLTPHMHWRP